MAVVGACRGLRKALSPPLGQSRRDLSKVAATGSWNTVWEDQERKGLENFEYQHLPKVELHRHLEGSVRLKTILDEARRHHIDHLPGVSLQDTKQVFDYFDVSKTGEITRDDFVTASKEMGVNVTPDSATALIDSQAGEGRHTLNLTEFEHLMEMQMLAELAPYVLTNSPFPDLKSLLDRFDRTQSVFKDMETFERIAFEATEDAYREGVRLLELRYAPSFCSTEHGHTFEEVLAAIQKGVRAATEKYDIKVGLICIAVGVMGPEEMERTVDFCIANKSAFVGFDMAGAETELTQWTSAFERVADAGVPITCHASEDRTTGKPENAVLAIESLGAQRVGHGVQIYQDKKMMDAVKSHNVLLEVSVSSNFLCGCFPSDMSHPARELWDHGIPLSINTDDPGIMSLDLQGEYRLWHQDLGFSGGEMRQSNVWALDHSFMPKADIDHVRSTYFE